MSLKIYKASAGSGKTYQLALEYICQALKSSKSSAFAHILAVTFTNKATSEMKDRILAYLYDIANDGNDRNFKNEVCNRLHLSDEEVKKRAQATLYAIIHDYDHFHVETIDSFLQSLLTNLAYELNLTRGFYVNLDTEDFILRAVNRLLLSTDDEDKKKKHITQVVWNMMSKKLDDAKGWNVTNNLKDFSKVALFNNEYLLKEEDITEFFSKRENIYFLQNKLDKIRKPYEEKLRKATQELQQILSDNEEINDFNKTLINSVRSYTERLYNIDLSQEPSKSLLAAIDSPEKFIKKDFLEDTRQRMVAVELSGKLKETETLRKEAQYPINSIDLTLKKLYAFSLLNDISNEMSAICSETNTFMLAKTPILFKKMVKGEDSSFVFERAGINLQHIMIDEFQDTSYLQWDIFKHLLLENMAQGEENTIVGDIKQSIYRWRGGDWKILYNIRNEIKGFGKQIEEKPLNTNYRSKEVIVNFNNDFFPYAVKFLHEQNEETYGNADRKTSQLNGLIEDIYKDVAQKVKDNDSKGGYVRIALFEDSKQKANNDTENSDIFEDLMHQIDCLRKKGTKFGDMAILVRKNEECEELVKFIAEKYPKQIEHFTSENSFLLSSSPAVVLIISALKYILSDQEDNVSFELCKKKAREIQEVCGVNIPNDLSSLITQREAILLMPLYELLQRLIHFFRLPEAEKQGAGQSAYLYSFLDYAVNYLEERTSKLADFIDFWDTTLNKKYIQTDETDAVQIMTIHKSKGLQRNTIFIPLCNWILDSDREEDIMWCETKDLDSPYNSLPLVPITPHKSSAVKASIYAPMYQREHINQQIDNINTLYVAFTRAEENLFIWGKSPKKDKKKSVYTIIEQYANNYLQGDEIENVYTIGKLQLNEKEKEEKKKEPQIIKNLTNLAQYIDYNEPSLTLNEYIPNEIFRQSNEARKFVCENYEGNADCNLQNGTKFYIDRGNILHYIFSLIKTNEDEERAIEQVKQQGYFESEEEEKEIRMLIKERLADEKAKQWFNGKGIIFAECTILQKNELGELQQIRPDRVIAYSDETVVIDYKTGAYVKKYDKQIEGYVKALTKMNYPNVHGYLWMLTTGEIIEVI